MKNKKPARLDGNDTLAHLWEQHALDRFDASDVLAVECEAGWHAYVTAGALQDMTARLQSANNYWLAGEWLNLPLGEMLRPLAQQGEAPPASTSRRPPISSADALMNALDIDADALNMHPLMSKPPEFAAEETSGEVAAALPDVEEAAASIDDLLGQASGGGTGSDDAGGASKGGLGTGTGGGAEEMTSAQPPPPTLQREEIRLDVVTPETAVVNEPFDMAVAIRQPVSPKLAIDDLPKLTSTTGDVYRAEGQDLIKYRVEVEADDCDVKPARYDFLLARGRDSIIQYFQLTPKRAGNLSIVVNAYQADSAVLAATTRVRLKAGIAVAANAASPAAQADAIKIYEALTSLFQLDDVQDIAFRLSIKWDELAGDTLSAKSRSLLTYCNDRSMNDQLKQAVKTLRPNADI